MRPRAIRAAAAVLAAGVGWWAGALIALDGLAPVLGVLAVVLVVAVTAPRDDAALTTLALVIVAWVLAAAAMAGLVILAVAALIAPSVVDAFDLLFRRAGLPPALGDARRIGSQEDRP